MCNVIMDLTPQIDATRLKQAIDFARRMGDGTVIRFTQEIGVPYKTDIYISVRRTNGCWEIDALKYGGFYWPEARRAVLAIANEILGGYNA